MGLFDLDKEQNIIHYRSLVSENADSETSGSWGTNQDCRYSQLVDIDLYRGASILEVGCGTGGFLDYLINNKIVDKVGGYCGIDIVEEMRLINQKNIHNIDL